MIAPLAGGAIISHKRSKLGYVSKRNILYNRPQLYVRCSIDIRFQQQNAAL